MSFNDLSSFLIYALWVLPIATLATWQAVEIWHHSALFADTRARVELIEGRIGQLLRCPFCLAPWVALAVCLVLALSVYLAAEHPERALLVQAPVYALAVSRLANVCSDIMHVPSRTPKMQLPMPPRDGEGHDDLPDAH